ncbi:hypothetical protein SB772_31715, partial [Paraburkholderia sp. SIMBA_030]
MQNDQQQPSLFSFIHPDHACLPRPVRAFCNILATLMFFAPVFMSCTSCLGILLGLDAMWEGSDRKPDWSKTGLAHSFSP